MLNLNLRPTDKDAIERFMENASEEDISAFEEMLNHASNDPRWVRYFRAAYNQPITWWMGIIQIQMVLGWWGREHQVRAQIRQSLISKALATALDETNREKTAETSWRFLKIAVRQPEFYGRLHGGIFTNYATTGGRYGSSRLPFWKVMAPAAVTNFIIAGFGAVVGISSRGIRSPEDLISAILFGEVKHLDKHSIPLPPGWENELEQSGSGAAVWSQLNTMKKLNRIAPQPAPVETFCRNSQNREFAFCKPYQG